MSNTTKSIKRFSCTGCTYQCQKQHIGRYAPKGCDVFGDKTTVRAHWVELKGE